MRDCGFAHLPADDSPDREVIDVFRDFLHDAGLAGVVPGSPSRPAVIPDTPEAREFLARWGPYVRGEYPMQVETDP